MAVSFLQDGSAHANDALVVYIECTAPDDVKTQGSGVLVSEQGHVLTARHVVPKGAKCRASIGNSTREMRGIRPSFESRKIDGDFDALLMEFGADANETFPYAPICALSNDLKEKEIIAKGFHSDSFGPPSSTNGILSNIKPNFNGIIETSAMTVNGKSGGPVFLKDTDTILGIVAGAKFTNTGVVSYYGMLTADGVLDDLDLLERRDDCQTSRAKKDDRPSEDWDDTLVAAAPDTKKDAAATARRAKPGPAKNDPNFPDDVDGYNVTYVLADGGYFETDRPGFWVQYDLYDNPIMEFVELGRSDWYVRVANYNFGIEVVFDGVQRTIQTYMGGVLTGQHYIRSVK